MTICRQLREKDGQGKNGSQGWMLDARRTSGGPNGFSGPRRDHLVEVIGKGVELPPYFLHNLVRLGQGKE